MFTDDLMAQMNLKGNKKMGAAITNVEDKR